MPVAKTSPDPRAEISVAMAAMPQPQLRASLLAEQACSMLVYPGSRIPMSPGTQSLLGPPKLGR